METQRIVIRKHGGPERLRLEDAVLGDLGAGQVRIATSYAGINFADIMMRMGLYPEAPKPPFTPGYEVSGEVVEVGEGVKGLKPGDRVISGTKFGGYATVVDVDAGQVVKLPKVLDEQAAVALPVNGLTAWAALVGQGRIKKGDRVLVHGGAGGVGLLAIGIAKRHGATVYATCGSDEKVRFLEEEAGVEQAFNYRAGPWRRDVLAEAGQMDIILDPVGGSNLHESRRCLAPFGRVVSYGLSEAITGKKRNLISAGLAMRQMKVDVLPMMQRNVGVSGLNLLSLWEQVDGLDKALRGLAADIVKGRMPAPRIDAVFPLEDAAAAHRYLQDRLNKGKVLLKTD